MMVAGDLTVNQQSLATNFWGSFRLVCIETPSPKNVDIVLYKLCMGGIKFW